MNQNELQAQFARCEVWQDTEQWELLALAYYDRGYLLNALCCFERADKCRVAAETDVVQPSADEFVYVQPSGLMGESPIATARRNLVATETESRHAR